MAPKAENRDYLVSLLSKEEQWLADDNATLRRLVAAGETHKLCPWCGKYLPTLRLLALRADWLQSGINYVADFIAPVRAERDGYPSGNVEHAYDQLSLKHDQAWFLAQDLKALLNHDKKCKPESVLAGLFRKYRKSAATGRRSPSRRKSSRKNRG